MSIISSAIKIVLLFAIAMVCADARASPETIAPQFVKLADGREIRQEGSKLVNVGATATKVSALRLPIALRHAIADASSIGFPVANSKVINAEEYVLVVVNSPSSSNPMGFCGAGEEGMLYVLRIRGTQADPRFAVPVQSCLKSISLATENNNKSPYLAITWTDAPAGIKIEWQHYGDAGPLTRRYKEVSGRFVQVDN